MTSRRNTLVYGMLFAIWAALIVWQAMEHERVKAAARDVLAERARYVAMSCARTMRSLARRSGGIISKEVLENTISNLVAPPEYRSIDFSPRGAAELRSVVGELRSVVLVNSAGEIAASAVASNANFTVPTAEDLRRKPDWDSAIVWLSSLVDFGTNLAEDVIVVPREVITNPAPVPATSNAGASNTLTESRGTNATSNAVASAAVAPSNSISPSTNATPPPGRAGGFGRGAPGRGDMARGGFIRPPWMSEDEFKFLRQKPGAHNFFVGMSTEPVHDTDRADLLIRCIIALLGTAAAVGFGLAWQSLVKTSDLQVRLVRASEMNLHLKEMNLAAAGLAHETRNPLNIIRGLAQMISKQQDATPEIRGKTRDIIDETDRVTAQLNEFINYSRPREVRRAPVDLSAVVGEVARTLNYDIEEKSIQLQIVMEPFHIEADEQLLRQALFNLVLNAVQAVPPKGEIRIRASKRNNEEAFIEISDNGPGVPQANRAEIFKPYFTTHLEGTGLGLSVVQQIVQAHGWDIACLPNEPAGALFRIAHIKLCGKD
jgi:signal transduction histidine kinase